MINLGELHFLKDVLEQSNTDLEKLSIDYISPQATRFIENAIKRYIPLERRVNTLEKEMELVKEEIFKLKNKKVTILHKSLVDLWDNEDDDIWNDY